MHFTKIALVVEYDGAAYHGFQVQRHSPTVQEVVEEAVKAFTGEQLRVHCASRTDAGVHAEGQVVSLRTGASYPMNTWMSALNHFLPEDVVVRRAYTIAPDYDIRRQATSRRYKYVILNRRTASPLLRQRAYWVPMTIDVKRANEAGAHLLGERDFAPFAGSLTPKGAVTVRRLLRAEFRRDGELIYFEVEGSSFLPQQVRRMAGALLEVGLGKKNIEEFRHIADTGERGAAGPTLPPHGLLLEAVCYRDFPPAETVNKNYCDGYAS